MKISLQEIEWLEYAIAHMLDDSEPEDQTCAKVLRGLVTRITEPGFSWWDYVEPCTDLEDANSQMAYMREDWQRMAEALGFEEFTDPEKIIERAQIVRNMLPREMHFSCQVYKGKK